MLQNILNQFISGFNDYVKLVHDIINFFTFTVIPHFANFLGFLIPLAISFIMVIILVGIILCFIGFYYK